MSLSSAVRVDLDDALLLGEVCYCAPDGDQFVVGVIIDQALTGMRSVLALIRSVMGEPAPLAETESPDTVYQGRDQDQ